MINYSYDADSRLITEMWLDSLHTIVNTQTYTYDADRNVLTAQGSSGEYQMSYDALDRVVTSTNPFGLVLTYTYDPAGNRTLVQDSLGGVTTCVYDAAHQLVSEQFGGAGETPLRIDITYDGDGRHPDGNAVRCALTSPANKIGSSAYTYNADEQVTNLVDRDDQGQSPRTSHTLMTWQIGLRPKITSGSSRRMPTTQTTG